MFLQMSGEGEGRGGEIPGMHHAVMDIHILDLQIPLLHV